MAKLQVKHLRHRWSTKGEVQGQDSRPLQDQLNAELVALGDKVKDIKFTLSTSEAGGREEAFIIYEE